MEPSLLLLLGLRGRAWARRWVRGVQSLKGLLLAVVGALVLLPLFISVIFMPRVQTDLQITTARRHGPLFLLAYCLLNVVLSSGDRAICYSPAEVNFLFSGPYRPRQLLIYKIVSGIAPAFLTSIFMTFAFAHHARMASAAFVGLFLALELLFLFSLGIGLLASTFGAFWMSRGKRVLGAVLALAAAGALFPLGRELLILPPGDLLEHSVDSPVVGALLLPFRPFVMTFTAERIWPDLILWASAAATVDLALLALVLGLNAQFLEASSAASARLYARLQRARTQGAAWADPKSARYSVPALPWWGGVGPNFWRQLTTAARTPERHLALLLLYLLPLGLAYLGLGSRAGSQGLVGSSLAVWSGIVLFAPSMVGYDFRPDLGRMEDLKTLPIRSTRVVLGQLITPVLVLSVCSWLALSVLALAAGENLGMILAAMFLVVPVNFLLVAIENLYFLWFPFRMTGINSFDFQAMGRQMLIFMAKFLTMGLATALSAAGGGTVYYLTDGSWPPSIAVAWIIALGCGLALTPLLAWAFDQFDVAASSPE